MTNWSIPASKRYETLNAATSANGALITNGAANTKGSYTTLGSATFDWKGFWLDLWPVNTNNNYFIDIAVSNSGAPTIIIPDLMVATQVNVQFAQKVFFPIAVPRNAALLARSQGANANTLRLTMTGEDGDFNNGVPCGKLKLGTNLVSSTTSVASILTETGSAITAWTEIVSAGGINDPWKGFYIALTEASDVSRTDALVFFDVGVGAAAAEQTILTSLQSHQSTTRFGGIYGPFMYTVPVSSRLSVRLTTNAAAAADLCGFAIYGLV